MTRGCDAAMRILSAVLVLGAISATSMAMVLEAQNPAPATRPAPQVQPSPDQLSTRIAVDFVDIPLLNALAIIADRSHVRLTYSSDDLPVERRVSLSDTSISVRAALDIVLATTALHPVPMSDGSVVLTTAVAVTGAAASPDAGADTSGTVTGTLIGRVDGQPVPFGTVMLVQTGETRFTDADGHFRVSRLLPGTYRLRARQIGYAPTDTTVRVDPAPAVTTVTIRLARLPSLLGLVKVEGRHSESCVATGVPDSTTDPALAAIFAQVEENVARYRLLWDAYPFRYTRQERTVLELEPGGDQGERVATESYTSRGQRSYHVGAVVYDELDEAGQPRRVMYLPTFRDLADTAFLTAHCFTLGGEQRLDRKSEDRVLRVDFAPASDIASPDVEGSILLDADRLIVRRAVFRLTKPESLDPPVIGVTVTSTYRELMPLVPVLEAARTVQPLPALDPVGSHAGAVTRAMITEDRLTNYRFDIRAPGDQSTAPSAKAPIVGEGGAVVEGRVVRKDGTPVQGAVVGVLASSDSTATNTNGHFVLPHIAPGAHMLWVHGVGFEPVRVVVTVSTPRTKPLTITMVHAVPVLTPIVTTEHFPSGYADVGLDKRIQAGLGQFMTLDQIDHRHATKLTDLLREFREIVVRRYPSSFEVSVMGTRGRWGFGTQCVGYVVDGVPSELNAQTGSAQLPPTGVDNMVDPSEVGAIEVYQTSDRPAGYEAVGQQCVLVVIWTRGRLGLTDADTGTAAGAPQAAPTHIPPRRPAQASAVPVFPTGVDAECVPPAPIDTVDLSVFAVLERGGASDAPDRAWTVYSERVLDAFRRAFALPTQLELPVFGPASPALTSTDLSPRGLAVAPSMSTEVRFTLDPTGALLESSIGTTSLSGDADTSVLAALHAAATTHSFPAMPATSAGRQSARFSVTVTTARPDSTQRAVVVDRLQVEEWPLARMAALLPGRQPDVPSTSGDHILQSDSATLEFVVDENGKAVMPTARAISRTAARAGDPGYQAVVSRIAQRLPAFEFDPALVGNCRVPQLILQRLAN